MRGPAIAGDCDNLAVDDLLCLAVAIIQSHPSLFADSGLPNDGAKAATIVAERAAAFVRTLRDELASGSAEDAGTRGAAIVEHLRDHSSKGATATDDIMALTCGEDSPQ